jgi:hypothetical protein
MTRQRYIDFEAGSRYRDSAGKKAQRLRDTLMINLGLSSVSGKWSEPLKHAIDDYVTNVLLNIDWYQRKAMRQYYKQLGIDVVVVLVVLVATGLSLYVALRTPGPGGIADTLRSASYSSTGPIAASLTAVLAMLKFVSDGHDFQKYRGNFWQAAADLKTRLYTLESDCSKAMPAVADAKGQPTPEFIERLRLENAEARNICRRQQDDYYQLLATPSTLLSSARSSRSDLDRAVKDRQTGQLLSLKYQRLDLESQCQALKAQPSRSSGDEARLGELTRRAQALHELELLLGDLRSF